MCVCDIDAETLDKTKKVHRLAIILGKREGAICGHTSRFEIATSITIRIADVVRDRLAPVRARRRPDRQTIALYREKATGRGGHAFTAAGL